MNQYSPRIIADFAGVVLQVDRLPLPHPFLRHYRQLTLSQLQALFAPRQTKVTWAWANPHNIITRLARRVELTVLLDSIDDIVAITVVSTQNVIRHKQQRYWKSSTSETSGSLVNSGSRGDERRGMLRVNSQLHPAPTVLESGWELRGNVRVLTRKRRVRLPEQDRPCAVTRTAAACLGAASQPVYFEAGGNTRRLCPLGGYTQAIDVCCSKAPSLETAST